MGVSALTGITVSISDTLVGTWSGAVCSASGGGGNATAWVFVQPLGATGGPDTITINVGSSDTQPVQFDGTFWQNISTSSPTNGSLCTDAITPGSGGSIDPGSFTPTTNNDSNGGNVIWNYTPICSGDASSNPSSWVPASGFSLLNGDIIWAPDQGFPEASQYYVQTTQDSVTPSITATGDTSDCFNSVSVALKVADNGASAPSTIHVVKIIHESWNTFSSPGTQKVMFPTVGNLRVFAVDWPGGCPNEGVGCIASVSSSDGCAFTQEMASSLSAAIYFAQNCSPCPACTLSITYSGTQYFSSASFRLYDIQNAAASSFQNATGGSNESCTATTINDAPSITPSGASQGLTISELGVYANYVTGFASGTPSGAVFDLWTFTGDNGEDTSDNADASNHLYFSSTAQQNWNYTISANPMTCEWEAAVFN